MLRNDSVTAVKMWSYFTLFISFWDFITFVMLGADYDKCLKFANSYAYWGVHLTLQYYCAIFFLPVFLIAAKGFVLWILNIVLALVVLRTTRQTAKSK